MDLKDAVQIWQATGSGSSTWILFWSVFAMDLWVPVGNGVKTDLGWDVRYRGDQRRKDEDTGLRKFPVLQKRCFSINFKWCQLEGCNSAGLSAEWILLSQNNQCFDPVELIRMDLWELLVTQLYLPFQHMGEEIWDQIFQAHIQHCLHPYLSPLLQTISPWTRLQCLGMLKCSRTLIFCQAL